MKITSINSQTLQNNQRVQTYQKQPNFGMTLEKIDAKLPKGVLPVELVLNRIYAWKAEVFPNSEIFNALIGKIDLIRSKTGKVLCSSRTEMWDIRNSKNPFNALIEAAEKAEAEALAIV